MYLTKHQLKALQNTPLEHKETFDGSKCFRYYSETTDSSFSDMTIKILRQFRYVKLSDGLIKRTQGGANRLVRRSKDLKGNNELE